ncbi:hypothetical protein M9H77_02602 [Catharanthus roseus]|uniref:Uncharacterized protein n=1 Tax=Catharanthus roseus TaxID=4058 RepID=A0ACC0C900_CATRO|nr:hypothetical protein M9H77_02602 [Catharanthus roseus]
MKPREHKVITYNPREGIYIVRSPIRVSGTDNNAYTLRMNNTSCSCRKWQIYTLPCSHALAICRENGTRADTYVPEIYLRQMYRRTYQANFNPILSENFWRDVPYNLTFYPPNMNKERGRKQDTQFQGEIGRLSGKVGFTDNAQWLCVIICDNAQPLCVIARMRIRKKVDYFSSLFLKLD